LIKVYLHLSKYYIFLSIDLPSIEKNKSSKINPTIVFLLIASTALITCIICCIHQCCRQRRHRDFTPIETQQESSILDRCYPQLPEASAPQFPYDLRSRWENIQHAFPSDNNTRVTTILPTVIRPTDEFNVPIQSSLITPIHNFFY
jgi:hypothetical protein